MKGYVKCPWCGGTEYIDGEECPHCYDGFVEIDSPEYQEFLKEEREAIREMEWGDKRR